MIELLALVAMFLNVKKAFEASKERQREIAAQEALQRDVAAIKAHLGVARPGTEVGNDYRRFL